jgi:hypothetical protein
MYKFPNQSKRGHSFSQLQVGSLVFLVMFQVDFCHLLQINFLLFLLSQYPPNRTHKTDSSWCHLFLFLLIRSTFIFTLIYIELGISQHIRALIGIIFHKEPSKAFEIFSIIFDIFGTGLFFNLIPESFDGLLDNRVTLELFIISNLLLFA